MEEEMFFHLPNVPAAADEWARDLLENIRRNFRTQGIYPFTDRNLWYAPPAGTNNPYLQWKSTGAGFDSLMSTVVAASENYAQVDLFYQRYLDFVDLGVGYYRRASCVDRTADYHHDARYAKDWDKKAGHTQRPIIQLELYNTRRRMLNYMRRFYLYNAPIYIMRAAGFECDPFSK